MPWKNDPKPFPQKQIIGDGRRSNKSTDTPWAFKAKTKSKRGPSRGIGNPRAFHNKKQQNQQNIQEIDI